MLEETLHKYFGYDTFRIGQKEVVESVLQGNDTLAVLPTGTGKSLCYQLSGYLLDGLVVIVSPLISLMEDQVSSLQKTQEKRVIALNSLLTKEEKRFVLRKLNQYKFLFASPEMLLQPEVLQALERCKIALLVIDEAHCVSQWGIDFRPEYRQLQRVKKRLKDPVTLALTATATKLVRNDIAATLLKENLNEIVYSVDRPNIALFVRETDDKFATLEETLKHFSGSGIIYCATRKNVEELYGLLKNRWNVGYYHGGLEANQRKVLQQQFSSGQLQLLIATNAFGMGINKPDIRFIIHYDLSDSLESYIQEIGRAGRDGQQSYAILLYQQGDEYVHHFFSQITQKEREGLERLFAHQQEETTPLQEKWQNQAQVIGEEAVLQLLTQNEEMKKQRLQNMLSYIFSTGCRRERLLVNFEEELGVIPDQCCDLHGAQLPDPETPRAAMATVDHWQEILLKLFKENI